MGYFGKAEEPSTLEITTSHASNAILPEKDAEKNAIQQNTNQIDPEIEKRVVRKLDKHVVTLLGFLCK